MSNLVPWTIIAKYLAGECNAEERAYLESWLEVPEHYTLFKELEETWKVDVKMEKYREYDIEKGLNLLNKKLSKEVFTEEISLEEPTKRFSILSRWSVAAGIGVLMTLAAVVGKRYWDAGMSGKPVSYQTKKSGTNEKIQLELPDGSIVWLNELSAIHFPKQFDNDKREVLLTGEAFFEVIPDKTRPFFVRTEETTIRVLGTSFNVHAYHREPHTRITVETGKVAVSDSEAGSEMKGALQLSPKQELVVDNKNGDTYINIVSSREIGSWREERLVFRSNTYEEVGKVLEEKYGVEIIIRNDELKKCKVMASFNKYADLSEILRLLSLSNGFSYTVNSNRVIIKGGSCH